MRKKEGNSVLLVYLEKNVLNFFLLGFSDCTNCTRLHCPFHNFLLPLIGESQPCANWSILHCIAPHSDWLAVPTADSSNPILPSEVLINRLADLCKSAVALAQRVTLAPVNDILSPVPRMSIWASKPPSGEMKLPDLAYLPQEYITQLGQYVFNLPEHLLPYMDTNTEDLNSTMVEQGACLAHCLRLTEPCASKVASATTSSRPRLSSGTDTVASPSIITAWLDWLLSGQVAEAFISVIFQIPSPLKVNNNDDKVAPGLSPHGVKQLLTDLG